MKARLALGIGALSCFAFLPAGVFAHQQTQSQKKGEKETVTGCLSKGQQADEYTLTTSDGTKYNVFEKSEKLSNDVGKTVKITGHLMNPNENSENSSANANANMNQPKDITVSHYTVVSQSCK